MLQKYEIHLHNTLHLQRHNVIFENALTFFLAEQLLRLAAHVCVLFYHYLNQCLHIVHERDKSI